MKRLRKNWSSLNNLILKRGSVFIFSLLFSGSNVIVSQVNLVGNPSFENLNCISPNFLKRCFYWNGIDSSQLACSGLTYNICYGTVPYAGPGLYQSPRTGNGYIRTAFYSPTGTGRAYPKNRLLSLLIPGNTYCVKMYVNLQNCSPFSLDALQIYLSDNTVDTITKCNVPLSYLTPQIQNPAGNFITDTLGWIEVSGTFTANGTEKYLVIGNFKSDAATSTSVTGSCTGNWSEYNVDDVSVIDFNLSAYAGPDKNIFLGDSAFIGRPPEVGLECTWTTGTTTVGSGGGLWVKPPIGTYSYIVTQNICGNIKTDTLIVNVSPSSINENTFFANSISIYPQPAKDLVTINLSNYYEPTVEIRITDVNGKLVRSSELVVRNNKTQIETQELSNGVYFLQIQNSKGQVSNKKLIISR